MILKCHFGSFFAIMMAKYNQNFRVTANKTIDGEV